MAETTITGLANANLPLVGDERVPMDQTGATVDATAQDIADLFAANPLVEQVPLTVRNQTGVNIAKGVAVSFAGTVGASGRLLIKPAIANGTDPPYYFLGVTSEAINTGTNGKVIAWGKILNVNTNAFNEGDILWVNPAVPGGFTATEPQAPNLKLPAAAVVNKGVGSGILMVRSTTGSRLADLHDVEANGSKTDGDVLAWDDAADRWEPKALTPADIGAATSAQGALADSAVQPGDLATVATSGAYSDLSGTPTLGTAAATDATDYAPAAEGVTNGDSHDHSGGDGAQIAYSSLSGTPTIPTPGGSSGDVQINSSGAFGAVTGFKWITGELQVPGDLLLEDGGTYKTTFSLVTPTANRTVTVPDATGTVGYVAGSNGQVPYNSSGAYAGGNLSYDATAGTFGYGAGRGTVTQATNKSTGVTLNAPCGDITMNGAALAADTTVSFTLTNSSITANDALVLNHVSGGTALAYSLNAQAAAGSASVNVRNITAGSLSEAIVIRFSIIKS
jgi:hypothetical protein